MSLKKWRGLLVEILGIAVIFCLTCLDPLEANAQIANSPPTVAITSPTSMASFTAPATVTIAATASDSDGTIARVEFYNRGILLGTSTAAPYQYIWTNVPQGTPNNYMITAKAIDNQGASKTSSTVYINVGAATNMPPTINITTPTNGTNFGAPANITINANAADSDGMVAKVEFYNGTTLLGATTAAPYSFSWNGVIAGSYSLSAKATDNFGASTTSTAVTISVMTAPSFIGFAPGIGQVVSGKPAPVVAASFVGNGSTINSATFNLLVDGVDVTQFAQTSATAFSYQSLTPLTDGMHTVKATVANAMGVIGKTEWSFTTVTPLAIYDTAPDDVSTLTTRPVIRARFQGTGLNTSLSTVTLDGQNQTAVATFVGDLMTLIPPSDLAPGVHAVRFSISATGGPPVIADWSFTITPAQIYTHRAKDKLANPVRGSLQIGVVP